MVHAFGVNSGVNSEYGPVPTALIAAMAIVYVESSIKPVTVHGEAEHALVVTLGPLVVGVA
jgi:hypothetical protein